MPKIASLVFFNHLSDASVGEDVPGMDEAVEHLSCLLHEVTLMRKIIFIIWSIVWSPIICYN
jgi:hypothetical protein